MREIKFRAYVADRQEMRAVRGIDWEYQKIHNGATILKLSDVILMQYTGLKDKNGKEIYEGDIVNCTGYAQGLYEVTFGSSGIGIKNKNHHYNYLVVNAYVTEIVGNIYETPELLEVK